MPFVNTFTADGTGLHQVGTGLVTGAEILTAAATIAQATDRAKKLRFAFVDVSGATEFRVTPDDVRLISRQGATIALLAPNAVVVIVAPIDDAYGMSRMWQTLVEGTGWQTAVFRQHDQAVTWLRDRIPDFTL